MPEFDLFVVPILSSVMTDVTVTLLENRILAEPSRVKETNLDECSRRGLGFRNTVEDPDGGNRKGQMLVIIIIASLRRLVTCQSWT